MYVDQHSESVGGDKITGNIDDAKNTIVGNQNRQEVNESTNSGSQKNVTNISLENNEHLLALREQFNRVEQNINYRFFSLASSINNRIRDIERDVDAIKRIIDKMDGRIERTNEQIENVEQQLKTQEQNSLLVKFAQPYPNQSPQQPVVQNGNLKRIFWALVGFGFILTILVSILIVVLARGS